MEGIFGILVGIFSVFFDFFKGFVWVFLWIFGLSKRFFGICPRVIEKSPRKGMLTDIHTALEEVPKTL